ncbi:hypothetical protein Taro_003034 [Colocasia esculenta]|uniref:Uncharacterized protein n=1 Tax=Colocasia esculenta TaxID=4460 RepID=A0A843TEC4_COLES|nr:hypothetical protein [Colocasia esculenta]
MCFNKYPAAKTRQRDRVPPYFLRYRVVFKIWIKSLVNTMNGGSDPGLHKFVSSGVDTVRLCVDTVCLCVDTTQLPDWDSVSTQYQAVSTLNPVPRRPVLQNWDSVSTHSMVVSTHSS